MKKQTKGSAIFVSTKYFLLVVVFLSFWWGAQRTIIFAIQPSFSSRDDVDTFTGSTATATTVRKSLISEDERISSASAETNLLSSVSFSSPKRENKQHNTKLLKPTTEQHWTAEQMNYIRPANWTNMTYWREGAHSRETPSGWWPDAQWVQNCVSHPETFDISPFRTLANFTQYQLGDCVRFCWACVRVYVLRKQQNQPPEKQQPKQRIHRRNNNTFAGRYYERACQAQYHNPQGRNRWSILKDIVDEMGHVDPVNYVKPDPDTILVHLRLGDKLEDSNGTVYEMLQNSAQPKGRPVAYKIKSVYEILAGIVESGADTVVLRGGSHKPHQYRKSKLYAYCLHEAVLRAGYNASIHLDEGNPDHDFFFLSHAKKAIISVGGYSQFVGRSVLNRGGIVYGRVFGTFADDIAESKI